MFHQTHQILLSLAHVVYQMALVELVLAVELPLWGYTVWAVAAGPQMTHSVGKQVLEMPALAATARQMAHSARKTRFEMPAAVVAAAQQTRHSARKPEFEVPAAAEVAVVED